MQSDPRALAIRKSFVIIIDEFSMMTNSVFHYIMMQIAEAWNFTLLKLRPRSTIGNMIHISYNM